MLRNLGRLRYARGRFSLFQGVACGMNDSSENRFVVPPLGGSVW